MTTKLKRHGSDGCETCFFYRKAGWEEKCIKGNYKPIKEFTEFSEKGITRLKGKAVKPCRDRKNKSQGGLSGLLNIY